MEKELEKLETLYNTYKNRYLELEYSDCPELFDTLWESWCDEGNETEELIDEVLSSLILNLRQTLGFNR